MFEQLHNPRWSLEEAIACREIARRKRLVRAAKLAKAELGNGSELSDDELDAILPPVECRRTRCRIAGVKYRRDGHVPLAERSLQSA